MDFFFRHKLILVDMVSPRVSDGEHIEMLKHYPLRVPNPLEVIRCTNLVRNI